LKEKKLNLIFYKKILKNFEKQSKKKKKEKKRKKTRHKKKGKKKNQTFYCSLLMKYQSISVYVN
jgi:hypothetical protein